jgi:hypothetical protein
MLVAPTKNNSSRSDAALSLANGFKSVRRRPAASPQVEVSPEQKEKLKHRISDGEKISRVLRFSSDSRIVQGLADRIFACSKSENHFLATDLHSTDTGELFNGKGCLWACNSRICPSCVAKLSKRNRKIARYVFENEKVFLGERWFFITLTMPDLLLKEFPLLFCRSVLNEAWRKFSRSAWFTKVIRGGMKGEEFTLGTFNQYHYHYHLLSVCKNRITSNDFVEIRREWTKALRFSFKKHGLKFECKTKDGLANVRVDRVYNKDRAILELCKYFTKSDSWAKIPSEQLADIATIERFPRAFEVFGVCKETVKGMKPDQSEKTLTEPANAKNEPVNQSANLNKDAYFNKNKITVRNKSDEVELSKPPPKRKQSWRVRCRILPRAEWLKSLEQEIIRCREYRMRQLRHKFAFATFQTLDGSSF